ncbi:MAG: hypothetical protein PHX02_07155 [Oscillospiraceae bacterium]|nr:hypothetical protein [Oscillospiraceae bacterium]
MIPNLQMDYFKYSRLFKGNYIKGATLLRSFLNDNAVADSLVRTTPAMAAVFTDFYKSPVNRLCYNVLAESPYFEEAAISYLGGVGATEHQTMDDLLDDTQNTLDILHNIDFAEVFQQNPELLTKTLLKPNIYRALIKDENTDIVLRSVILETFSEVLNPAAVNIYTPYNAYWTPLVATTTPFDSGLIFYQNAMYTASSIISEETNTIFVPSMVSGRTSTGSTTYYYYPAVFKYDISAGTWSLLYVASGDVRQSNSTNNSRSSNGVAYDPDNDNLYIFYRPSSSSAVNMCDIVKGADGSVVQTGIEVANVGISSTQVPVFCCFDKVNHLAKYVWRVGEMDAGSGSTTGWLYGCSVSANGLVWAGKAAHPNADQGLSVFSTAQTSLGASGRFSDGAYVGAFQTGSTIGTSNAVMVSIASSNDRIKANYLTFETGTSYSQLASPTYIIICENGFSLMAWDTLKGYPTLAAIRFLENEINLLSYEQQSTTTYKYTVYGFPAMNKAAGKTSQSTAQFQVFGTTPSGVLKKEYPAPFDIFNETLIPARGSDLYKLDIVSSSNWVLYDYMP